MRVLKKFEKSPLPQPRANIPHKPLVPRIALCLSEESSKNIFIHYIHRCVVIWICKTWTRLISAIRHFYGSPTWCALRGCEHIYDKFSDAPKSCDWEEAGPPLKKKKKNPAKWNTNTSQILTSELF